MRERPEVSRNGIRRMSVVEMAGLCGLAVRLPAEIFVEPQLALLIIAVVGL